MLCVGLGCAYAPATRDVPSAGDDGGTLLDSGTIANGDGAGTPVEASSGTGSSGSTGSASSSGGTGNGSGGSSGSSGGSSSSGVAAPTIQFVQIAGSPLLVAKSSSVTFGQAQTAGNLIVLAVGWQDASSKISKVSDLAGDTFQLATGAVKSVGTALSQSIYYATNIAASLSNTITVAFTAIPQKVDLRAMEYSGVSAFDTASGLNDVGVAANSGTATPSGSPPELLVAAGITSQKYSGSVMGFMLRTTTNSAGIVEDRLTSKPGPCSASAPVGPPGEWLLQLAAFR